MRRVERQVAIRDLMSGSGVRFGTSGARGGVVDMTSTVCFSYTAAFLQSIRTSSGNVALAIDLRPSSPDIAAACAAAIRHAGLSVDYCGAIPTPALACYSQAKGIPAIMVTGSHIPFDRNGIKFYGASGEITKADEECIENATIALPDGPLTASLPEANEQACQHYIDRYLGFFPENCLAGMKIGFYEHSSVARDLLRDLLERLGAQVIALGRTDEFVPIDTEAVAEADIERAAEWAKQYGFDAIISTDGDADRPLVGDESGRWLRGDVTGILCARYLGAQAVATTVSCNTAVELCGAFATVARSRIGSPYVIAAMDDLARSGHSRVVGFEPNGGFLVGSTVEKHGRALAPLQTRDAVLPILCLLSMARECGGVSRLTESLPPRYTYSDRIQNFPTETSRVLLDRLAGTTEHIAAVFDDLCGMPARLDQTDGLRILFENGELIHFRPSGNAPELRCYAESTSPARAHGLVVEGLKRIKLLSERAHGNPVA